MNLTRVAVDSQMNGFLVALGNPDCEVCRQPLSRHRWYDIDEGDLGREVACNNRPALPTDGLTN